MSGLIRLPASSAATTRRSFGSPCRDRSPSAQCAAAKGYVLLVGSKYVAAQPRLHAFRQRNRNIGKGSDFGERLCLRRGTDHDLAASKTMSSGAASRRAPANCAIFVRTWCRPYAAPPPTACDRLPNVPMPCFTTAVAVMDRDVLDRHAELIGKHLSERRFVTLPVRRGASRC